MANVFTEGKIASNKVGGKARLVAPQSVTCRLIASRRGAGFEKYFTILLKHD